MYDNNESLGRTGPRSNRRTEERWFLVSTYILGMEHTQERNIRKSHSRQLGCGSSKSTGIVWTSSLLVKYFSVYSSSVATARFFAFRETRGCLAIELTKIPLLSLSHDKPITLTNDHSRYLLWTDSNTETLKMPGKQAICFARPLRSMICMKKQ